MSLYEKNRRRRRRDILMAAAEVFRTAGFVAARIDAIAERAEVATATVYNYFPTKDALLLALVNEHRAESIAKRELLISNPVSDPVEALHSYFAELVDISLLYLDKSLWRHVCAASIVGSWENMSEKMMKNEQHMIKEKIQILRALKSRGCLSEDIDEVAHANIIHSVGYFLWQVFLSEEELTADWLKASMKAKLSYIFSDVGMRCRSAS
ncbi:MAG: TetR/AcrR family transcriptional regulator [Parvibaculaceae bacterium]